MKHLVSPIARARALAALALLLFATTAAAQDYPSKPVRFLVGLAPGGGTDIVARILASKLTETWGQQMIVENRTGAGGSIATDMVAKAAPDGHTLLLCNMATHAIGPALHKKLPYDHIRDFAPISMVGTTPNILVVHPSMPVRTIKEFVALAKANPGKINYGSSGVGTALHLTMELFRTMTGIDVVHVPYKGGSTAGVDLMAGHIGAMFANLPTQLGAVKAGKVRALGVSSAKRHPLVPDVPAISESVPGFEVTVWHGLCAPGAAPKAVVTKLNADVVKALSQPDVQRRLSENGVDAAPSSPEQFAAFIKKETAKWAKAVRDSGATAE
ncbi:MAG: Bug family tripartite tricarboxylate transporter substrate binding protein [Burkholderiales bacterium]